jgi:hypothetical protein
MSSSAATAPFSVWVTNSSPGQEGRWVRIRLEDGIPEDTDALREKIAQKMGWDTCGAFLAGLRLYLLPWDPTSELDPDPIPPTSELIKLPSAMKLASPIKNELLKNWTPPDSTARQDISEQYKDGLPFGARIVVDMGTQADAGAVPLQAQAAAGGAVAASAAELEKLRSEMQELKIMLKAKSRSSASRASAMLGLLFEPEGRVLVNNFFLQVSPWCENLTPVTPRTLAERQADIYCYCKERSTDACVTNPNIGVYVISVSDYVCPLKAVEYLPDGPEHKAKGRRASSPGDEGHVSRKYVVGEISVARTTQTRIRKLNQLESVLAYILSVFNDRKGLQGSNVITDITRIVSCAILVFCGYSDLPRSEMVAEILPSLTNKIKSKNGDGSLCYPNLYRLAQAGRFLLFLAGKSDCPLTANALETICEESPDLE